MKKDLDDYLELIQSEGIRNFVKTALAAAPPEFWIAPASSSGKYHPPEDNMEGGLVIHSRKAVRVAIALCRFFGIEDGLMKDMVIAPPFCMISRKAAILGITTCIPSTD